MAHLVTAKARAVLEYVLGKKAKPSPALLCSETAFFKVSESKENGITNEKHVTMLVSIYLEDESLKEKILNSIYYPDGKTYPSVNFQELFQSSIDDLRPWLPGKPYFGNPDMNFEFEEVEAGCARYMSQLLKTSPCCELNDVKIRYSLAVV